MRIPRFVSWPWIHATRERRVNAEGWIMPFYALSDAIVYTMQDEHRLHRTTRNSPRCWEWSVCACRRSLAFVLTVFLPRVKSALNEKYILFYDFFSVALQLTTQRVQLHIRYLVFKFFVSFYSLEVFELSQLVLVFADLSNIARKVPIAMSKADDWNDNRNLGGKSIKVISGEVVCFVLSFT